MVQDNSQLRLDLGLGLRTQGVGSVAKTSAGKMRSKHHFEGLKNLQNWRVLVALSFACT